MKTRHLEFKLLVVLLIITSSSVVFTQNVCISIYNLMPVFQDSSPFTNEKEESDLICEEGTSSVEQEPSVNNVNSGNIKINYTIENIFSNWIRSYSILWLNPTLNKLNDDFRKKY
jgi:hypothetical protein